MLNTKPCAWICGLGLCLLFSSAGFCGNLSTFDSTSTNVFGHLSNGDNESPFNLKGRSGHFNSEDLPQSHCVQPTDCQPLTKNICLGATLPYKSTTFSFVNGTSLDDVEAKLLEWTSLKRVPRCWAVMQPFLCAVYLPKCDSNGVVRPSRELCRITRAPCRIMELGIGWPDFLQCSNEKRFPADCKHDMKEIKFNLSGSCMPPLVESDQPSNWYKWVDGCGVQCMNPLVSSDQHKQIHSFIAITGSLCLTSNIFVVLTFLIDWRNSRRYPAVIIFYINGCYMMACIGWLSQFSQDGRKDIVCHRDGTARRSQPGSGETLSCLSVFILIYYFTMAASIWFVLLAFAWDVSFRSVGIPRKLIQSKSAYFHLAAWSLPFVMTIAIMAMQEVDGDSLYGICFVAFNNMSFRILFLLAPLSLAWISGTFFLSRGLMTLVGVKFGSSNVMSHHVKSRIKNMIVRLGVFLVCIGVAFVGTLICHALEYMEREQLTKSLQNYIVCLSMPRAENELLCKVSIQPNLLVVHLQLLFMFGTGLAMSSWVWTKATLTAWTRFFYRVGRQQADEPAKFKRHKMIAQAFAHRDNYSHGHMTLTCDSTHEDPVGMNLEPKSIASRAPSSTWAAALPKFLMRRGALSGSGPLGLRRHSSTSDISQCPIPMVTLSGRRHSMDSQNSLGISEQDWIATELARQRRRKTRKERERLIRGKRLSPWLIFGRRGSDTSQQSSATNIEVKRLPKKVTKATSTGDLGQVSALFYRPPTALVFPVTRPLVQRQAMIFPPFTHGMADNPSRISSDGRPLLSPNGQSRTTVPHVNSYAMPNQVLPMTPGYPLPAWIPYGPPYMGLAALLSNHEPILPMNPMPDSCSEADFFPIVMSDSDFTDTGFRSPQEDHVAKIVRDRIEAIIQPSPVECENVDLNETCRASDLKDNNLKTIIFETSKPPLVSSDLELCLTSAIIQAKCIESLKPANNNLSNTCTLSTLDSSKTVVVDNINNLIHKDNLTCPPDQNIKSSSSPTQLEYKHRRNSVSSIRELFRRRWTTTEQRTLLNDRDNQPRLISAQSVCFPLQECRDDHGNLSARTSDECSKLLLDREIR